MIPTNPAEGCWEHELFWVSKMFFSEPTGGLWTPPETFVRKTGGRLVLESISKISSTLAPALVHRR